MKRSRFCIRALALFLIFHTASLPGVSQHRLVLLHPTVSNIESMLWMIDNKVIDIPGVELLGVYAANEAYDYTASENYLIQHHTANYKLRRIEGEIKPDDIYKENVLTPALRKILEESDALLFFGGPDIPAAVYGEKQNQLTVVTDPNRHYFETSFFFQLIGGSRNPGFTPLLAGKPDYIIRAFCLGMQTMNVAAGGTLIQDIPSERYHKNTVEGIGLIPPENQHRSSISPRYPLLNLFGGTFHPVRMTESGYLKELTDQSGAVSPYVLSFHHQAVGKMGAHLAVIATSMDKKIVEGLQHSEFKNVIGVQFHPESSSLYKPETRLNPSPERSFSPYKLLSDSKSLTFHQFFWKDFSDRVMKSKRLSAN